ncbi:hypothetical protein EVAR_44093_1 [Eumeta japonica]|uniref:Uncharacterized protein n=1 Tax=Eumeta variegata TaxID=151549 RepID=A0A4C1X0I4_EUMVA|nr:hypothetical protein EVAR_44093_1 [Eumeta japonica]
MNKEDYLFGGVSVNCDLYSKLTDINKALRSRWGNFFFIIREASANIDADAGAGGQPVCRSVRRGEALIPHLSDEAPRFYFGSIYKLRIEKRTQFLLLFINSFCSRLRPCGVE